MSENILKFGDIIALHLEDIKLIVKSDKFKHSGKCSKYFTGYEDNDIIRPLCIVCLKLMDT